ncbi:restriction endonuclease subunit S [Dolichospermum flos-aquae]|uniref:Restriction endonuclease subunit S n=1 Tax=Dolichospermum flos-aquae LEGE 04289 TaxID=1828708 RepID=A0ACC5Q6A6_DOLFA|nr:restriction endonuclease subunit S [Dolichospermum flos-aquae]MBE9220469.1 restriction endonuclease subunit S [Dolichospermum flos-aquae LEGE 04289]
MKWQQFNLESLCHIVIGATPSRRNPAYWGGKNVWVTISELNGSTIYDSREYITDLGVAESPSKLIPSGTLLFSFKLSIGKMAIAGCDLYTNEAIAALPIRSGIKLDRDFLRYSLLYLNVKNGAEVSVKGALLNKQKIAAIKIPFPPHSEQRRIVEILDQADALRKMRAEADAKAERILPALFIKMFGDPSTNPMGWDVEPLKCLGKITTGNTPPTKNPEYYGNDIEWIKSNNINTPHHILTRAEVWLSSSGKKIGRVVPANSTLVTCIAGSPSCIGNAALADREVAFNQQINAITPNPDINPFFLYVQILLLKKVIQRASTNAMKGMVSKGKFEEIPAIRPPKSLQLEFGDQFLIELELHRKRYQSHCKLDAIFELLLQRAFSGELTAKWREAHIKELLAEMEEQAKVLNLVNKQDKQQLSFL